MEAWYRLVAAGCATWSTGAPTLTVMQEGGVCVELDAHVDHGVLEPPRAIMLDPAARRELDIHVGHAMRGTASGTEVVWASANLMCVQRGDTQYHVRRGAMHVDAASRPAWLRPAEIGGVRPTPHCAASYVPIQTGDPLTVMLIGLFDSAGAFVMLGEQPHDLHTNHYVPLFHRAAFERAFLADAAPVRDRWCVAVDAHSRFYQSAWSGADTHAWRHSTYVYERRRGDSWEHALLGAGFTVGNLLDFALQGATAKFMLGDARFEQHMHYLFRGVLDKLAASPVATEHTLGRDQRFAEIVLRFVYLCVARLHGPSLEMIYETPACAKVLAANANGYVLLLDAESRAAALVTAALVADGDEAGVYYWHAGRPVRSAAALLALYAQTLRSLLHVGSAQDRARRVGDAPLFVDRLCVQVLARLNAGHLLADEAAEWVVQRLAVAVFIALDASQYSPCLADAKEGDLADHDRGAVTAAVARAAHCAYAHAVLMPQNTFVYLLNYGMTTTPPPRVTTETLRHIRAMVAAYQACPEAVQTPRLDAMLQLAVRLNSKPA